MVSYYFDDLQPGQRFVGAGRHVIDEKQIVDFARQFDPQLFHLDAEAAKKTLFGGLVASGWHTAAITMRLLVEAAPVAGGLVGLGGESAWPLPVKPGDTLRVEGEVLSVKPSRAGDRGVVTVKVETLNQRGEAVQILTAKLRVPARPK